MRLVTAACRPVLFRWLPVDLLVSAPSPTADPAPLLRTHVSIGAAGRPAGAAQALLAEGRIGDAK